MLSWNLIKKILYPESPKFAGSRAAPYEELLDESLTMGTLYIGRQGTGKTTSLSRHIVDYFKKHLDRAIFVLDWSGSISKEVLKLLLQESPEAFEKHEKRVVYDPLGHPEWVIPLPEFSHIYGSTYEEQVQRVANNLVKLAPELVSEAPFVAGLGLREIGPQLFRLITSIENDYYETWQITEAKKLLTDKDSLKRAVDKYGYRVESAKWFLEEKYLKLSNGEKELRTFALIALMGAIETPEAKSRVGYSRPGWTPREAISNGLMVLVDGSRLINQKNTQHYLFTQAYSLIMSEINKREPANPKDQPVALVMDEVYSLLSIPGMAQEIGMISPLYRSRKLELYIVLQALSQLAPELKAQIWSLGNIISFAISNFDEAYEIAQQLFKYEPQTIKFDPKVDNGQPIVESDRGQYLQIANEIQRLERRECVIRRYQSEKVMDKKVLWVKQTRDVLARQTEMTVDEFKERLFKARGVRVRDSLKVITERDMKKGFQGDTERRDLD